MSSRIFSLTFLSVLFLVSPNAGGEFITDVALIQPGHWIEARGNFNQSGLLETSKIEIIQPQKYIEIIGLPDSTSDTDDALKVFGIRIKTSEKTKFRNIQLPVKKQRIKIEGYYRGSGRVSARRVSARDPGRDRILGRLDKISSHRNGHILLVMGKEIFIPSEISVGHEYPIDQINLDHLGFDEEAWDEDDDDRFGTGWKLSDSTNLTLQLEGRSTGENNYDLNEGDEENRLDNSISARARLSTVFSEHSSARLELRHQQLFRQDDDDGNSRRSEFSVGEAYYLLQDVQLYRTSTAIDLQIGRQDFDDPREWLFDENLDAISTYWSGAQLQLHVAIATTLFDGDARDRDTRRLIGYLSNRDDDRHLATYIINRHTDNDDSARSTHLGVRALGNWIPRSTSWLEIAHLNGNFQGVSTNGFGFDAGITYALSQTINLTAGFAFGEGSQNDNGRESTFRQTELQDNNGKFGGVTSFRYYGELFDPELSNLLIATAGIGFRPVKQFSLDFVGHYYQQHVARDQLTDSELDADPNGSDKNLGWEVDVVVGWRIGERWSIEGVVGYFKPGSAFDDTDGAALAKLQLRYH